MKKTISALLLACSCYSVSAQSGRLNYAVSIARFQQWYNDQQADSIFGMFAPAMRSGLPLDKTRATVTALHSQVGKLKQLSIFKEEPQAMSYKAEFEKATLLIQYSLNDKNQLQGIFFNPYQAEKPVAAAPGVEYTIAASNGAPVSGTLLMPKTQEKIPVVLIIAGSGPTDRDCNSSQGINSNAYRMLADSLFAHGIASLRYDKRGIGKSRAALTSESEMHIEDIVSDAVSFIKKLRGSGSFSRIILAGHSEGALIATLAAEQVPVNGVIAIAGAGEPADNILLRQLKDDYPQLYEASKPVLKQLKEGKMVPVEDIELQKLFRESVQPYMISWIKYDPAAELKKLKVPVMIIQGNTDLQVSVNDAKNLKAARPDAELLIIDQMNHVLKTAPADKNANAATYINPQLPLHKDLFPPILRFVQQAR